MHKNLLYLRIVRIFKRNRSLKTVELASRTGMHEYWKNPLHEQNTPEAYLEPVEKSRFVFSLVAPRAAESAVILEIGCNVGRDLSYLHRHGYRNLHGIEISQEALRILRERFPDMAAGTDLVNQPVEDAIGAYADGSFDVVYTLACLGHIHPDSDWVFSEMARVSRQYVITIENEYGIATPYRFPRNYRRIFQGLGMTQEYTTVLCHAKGLSKNYRARVFRKNDCATVR